MKNKRVSRRVFFFVIVIGINVNLRWDNRKGLIGYVC